MHCLTSAAIALLVVLFSGFVSNRLLAAGATGFDLQKLVRSTATTFGVAPTLLLIALLVPIVEELVFRAALLDAYTRHMRFGVANTLQALLFAAAHLNPAHSAQLFVLGFCSGLLRQRSRGLLASIALHAFNNAIAVVLTLSAAQVQYNAPPRPFNHLPIAQCAGKTAERKDVSALNALVWEVATSKEASRECLLTALEAQDEVLYQVTEPSFLDTQATLLHRLGRQEEAIDLQRVVIERLPQPITFSQLDRFLPNALTVYGDAKPEQIALSSKGITFTQGYPYGVEVYARSSDGGLLRATFGRGHLLNYDFDWKADAAPTIVPAVMLIDARGVDGANPGDWSWHYEPHDPTVDTYP